MAIKILVEVDTAPSEAAFLAMLAKLFRSRPHGEIQALADQVHRLDQPAESLASAVAHSP